MDAQVEEILDLEDDSTLVNIDASAKITDNGCNNFRDAATNFSDINGGKSKRTATDELDGHLSKKPSTPPFSYPQLTPQDDDLLDRASLEKKLSLDPSPKENQPPKIMHDNPVPTAPLPHVRVTIEDLKRSSMLPTSGPIILRSKGNIIPPPLIPLNTQLHADYLDK